MNRRITHRKLVGVCLALVVALSAPAAAQAISTSDVGRTRAAHDAVSAGELVVSSQQQGITTTGPSGLTWAEAAVGIGIAIGILLLGLWGDVAVGAVIVGVAALVGAGARLVIRRPRVEAARTQSGQRTRESRGQPAAL